VPQPLPSTTGAQSVPSPPVSPDAARGAVTAVLAGIGDEYYPYLGNPGYDVAHYDLAISFDPVENRLSARATFTAIAVDTLDTFNLDFDRLTVREVRVDGRIASFIHVDDRARAADPLR
jgi:aminopeptidase N